ncbi:hypothetical protein [Streptomyces mangrovisoli]|uniref:hypothetical protein n=1 Tax=Streptomyces mangrovisoli TaxID=1428628 RepID=UPI00062195EF|nr:hypothetical protein [Streptomyces mangrovisoli]
MDDEAQLMMRFAWHSDQVSPLHIARSVNSVSLLESPTLLDADYETAVGDNGAISTAPCKTKGGNYFTLTLQLPQVPPGTRSYRHDIERFMRAYFPATLKTLGCRDAGQR